MGRTFRKHRTTKSKNAKTIKTKLSFDERLNALADTSGAGRKIVWTEEKDKALLKYWPTKNHGEVAAILGHTHDTCRKRYNVLTEEGVG